MCVEPPAPRGVYAALLVWSGRWSMVDALLVWSGRRAAAQTRSACRLCSRLLGLWQWRVAYATFLVCVAGKVQEGERADRRERPILGTDTSLEGGTRHGVNMGSTLQGHSAGATRMNPAGLVEARVGSCSHGRCSVRPTFTGRCSAWQHCAHFRWRMGWDGIEESSGAELL